MALNINGVKLLLRAKAEGVDFRQTLMIGRQRFRLREPMLARLLAEYGYESSQAADLLRSAGGYVEPLLHLLGAQTIQSLDVADYEGAELLHDMNLPVPRDWHQQFSVVLDGGSLEHVFNFPTGIKNCMELVAKEGCFLSITPTNNFLGHGFYQFSPELFYRVFTAANGYATEEVLLYTDIRHRMKEEESTLYQVADPLAVRRRVEFVNAEPSCSWVRARREEVKPVFAHWPQQSDYEHLRWQGKKVVKQLVN